MGGVGLPETMAPTRWFVVKITFSVSEAIWQQLRISGNFRFADDP
jgi:hypothetical protein